MLASVSLRQASRRSRRSLHASRVLRGEVGLFAEVGGEVEQFDAVVLDPMDEFPVADANAAARAAAVVAVVGEVPEEGFVHRLGVATEQT